MSAPHVYLVAVIAGGGGWLYVARLGQGLEAWDRCLDFSALVVRGAQ